MRTLTGGKRRLPGIDQVGPLLEGGRKAAKGEVEHGTHEQGQHPALEFIGDEEFDVAARLPGRPKGPAVLHSPDRAIEVFDRKLQLRAVAGEAPREGLAVPFYVPHPLRPPTP